MALIFEYDLGIPACQIARSKVIYFLSSDKRHTHISDQVRYLDH